MREFGLNVFILLVKWEMRSSTENEKASNRKGHLERMEKLRIISAKSKVQNSLSYFCQMYMNHTIFFRGKIHENSNRRGKCRQL